MARRKSEKVTSNDDFEMGDAPTAASEQVDEGERAGGEDNGNDNDGEKAAGSDGQSDDGESAEPKKGKKPKVPKSAEEEAEDAAKKAREKAVTEAVSRVCRFLWWRQMPPKYSLTESIALGGPFCVEGWQTRTVRNTDAENER